MNTKDLSEFYAISPQAVGKWDSKKRQQKTTQALAGAEPQITNLIGEINQLAYVFDCQNLQGVHQTKWCQISRYPQSMRVTIFGEPHSRQPLFFADVNLDAHDSVVRLLLLKTKLSEMVYGAQKID